jgi:hypothetical protein
MKTWEEFNRFRGTLRFYGCVAPDGRWFDSAISFSTAIHFCCYDAGELDLTTTQEMEWMETKGKAKGYSIIHSFMLERMYEKELLK